MELITKVIQLALKSQNRNLVEVETVVVDVEMVVLLEVNSKETEIVLHAAVMVEIVVTEVLEEIVMVVEIVTIALVVTEDSEEKVLQEEKEVRMLEEADQDRSVNRSTKNKLIKHFV